MDADSRFIAGVVIVGLLYWAMGGTVIYAIRRYRAYEPRWSWRQAMVAFFCIELGAVLAVVVPVAGLVLSSIAFYTGFKYATGLGFIRTMFLGFAMLILILALTSLVGYLLEVDLNAMWAGLGARPH